jgi:hypothetical protein
MKTAGLPKDNRFGMHGFFLIEKGWTGHEEKVCREK